MQSEVLNILEDHHNQLSNAELFDQWKALELRKRYWIVECRNIDDSENRAKLANVETWMNKIWAELEKRIDDRLPFKYLLELINGGFEFTILE